MGNISSGQKKLKKLLSGFHFSTKTIGPADENAVSLLLTGLYFVGPGQKLMVEVPGTAVGEKIRLEIQQWARCAGLEADVLQLPDGTNNGRKLMESEMPRAQVLDRVLHDPPDILIVSAGAELSPAPDPERMRHLELTVRTGMTRRGIWS